MTGFNIESLLDFKPAQYQCEKCLALLQTPPSGSKSEAPQCPICKVRYVPTDDYSYFGLRRYLKDSGWYIPLKNPTEHGRTLAAIAAKLKRNDERYPPLRALLESLNAASHFVHFTTYGVSHLLIGALKMASLHVPVRGIVSNVDAMALKELSPNYEAPNFKARTYGTEASWAEMPHQKLIVIDGLLAFKGSANLTLNAWRKVAQGRDFLEVETDVERVISLHNQLFSPLWGQLSGTGDEIQMLDDIPF